MLVQPQHPQGGPDLLSACATIDIWVLSEVTKALCGAAIRTVLLVVVLNLKKDQSAVVLAVHCPERNEIDNHRKEIRD